MRKIALAALAAPLTLAISACDSSDAEGGVTSGEPIENIAAPAGTEWADTVTVSDYDGYIIGNPDAPIKLVEYASLTCGGCAQFSTEAAAPIASEYVSTGRVSYEIRNLVRGPDDLVLAGLVRCGAKESYHPLSEQVWSNFDQVIPPFYQNQAAVEQAFQLPEEQRFAAIAEIAGYYEFFAARGISTDQARQCLSDVDSMRTIAENSSTQAAELNVTGTPTFFLNGERITVNGWASLEPMLQEAGAR